jgi:hypothetical protein
VNHDEAHELEGLAGAEPPGPDWDALISAAATNVRPPVVAQQHIRALPGGSRAQLFRCDDGALYAVKFRNNPHGDGRSLFTEQVVALLGKRIGAAVPDVRLVSVTAELLVPLNIDLGGGTAEPGLHHGSCWAEGFSDRLDFLRYPDRNRSAFAALRVLYSWMLCTGDHQVIYRNSEPHEVLSVDHGLFLPGSSGWSAQSLQDHRDALQLDPQFDSLKLTDDEHEPTLNLLETITDEAIADVASASPAEWGITQEERVSLARYAARRRIELLALFGRSGR